MLDLKAASHADDYRMTLRAAVRGLWSGALDWADHFILTQAAVRRAFTLAWAEGAASYGLAPEDYTPEERLRLETEIARETAYITKLTDAVEANRRGVGKLTPLLQRADLWAKGYTRIVQLAKTYAARDKKLEWQMGATIEHCRDCQKYNGRVYRASIWRKYAAQPRTWELDCHGLNCLCTLVPTDKKVTPGFPPAPSGGRAKETTCPLP